MNESIVRSFLGCPGCKNSDLDVVAFERAENPQNVLHGVVVCKSCHLWYRIEDGLLEMIVPSLRDAKQQAAFQTRFASKWHGWKGMQRIQAAPDDAHKQGQKEFYDGDANAYEGSMLQLSFWKSFDRIYRQNIQNLSPAGKGIMLEIGCGTGRVSLPMAEVFKTILGFDLSENMVRTAIRKRGELPLSKRSHIHYFVGDAENIPIKSGMIDTVVLSGILHHVESPGKVVGETSRTLKPEGHFLGVENNRSFFRPIFDAAMHVWKLWNEKAHEEHFIMSHRELEKWFVDARLDGKIWTSVFLPPHFFNLLSEKSATWTMSFSDAVARSLPWFGNQGGLIIFSGAKPKADTVSEPAELKKAAA